MHLPTGGHQHRHCVEQLPHCMRRDERALLVPDNGQPSPRTAPLSHQRQSSSMRGRQMPYVQLVSPSLYPNATPLAPRMHPAVHRTLESVMEMSLVPLSRVIHDRSIPSPSALHVLTGSHKGERQADAECAAARLCAGDCPCPQPKVLQQGSRPTPAEI